MSARIAALKAEEARLDVRGLGARVRRFLPVPRRHRRGRRARRSRRRATRRLDARRRGRARRRRARHGDGLHGHAAFPPLTATERHAVKVLSSAAAGASTRSHGSSRSRRRSARCSCAPGNAGTAARAEDPQRRPSPSTDFAALVDLAREGARRADRRRPRGPARRRHRRSVSRRAGSSASDRAPPARSSRARRRSRRSSCARHRIPTAAYQTFTDFAAARDYVRTRDAADRHQSRRARRRQRRHHRADASPRRSRRSTACCAQRQFGASRRDGRDRGLSRRRGSELHRGRRRHARRAARELAGPQDARRRRPRPEHGRHGRLFAGPRRDRRRPRARHAARSCCRPCAASPPTASTIAAFSTPGS